jgi:hypothetical protein
MTPSRAWAVALLIAILALGCGGNAGNPYSLPVGSDDGGGGSFVGGDDASASGAFDASIEQKHVAVTFVTLTCSDECADVVAVATGGRQPYTFAWDDGSTSAARHVCPTSSTRYSVKVTDTGTSGELARPAETLQVPLAANVIACPDGGASDGGAPIVYWATWTRVQPGSPGTAAGSFSPPTGSIGVTYAGEVDSSSTPTGTATVTALGAVSFVPASTFLSPTVGNIPPATGMIVLGGSAMLTQTITFSAPVTDPPSGGHEPG